MARVRSSTDTGKFYYLAFYALLLGWDKRVYQVMDKLNSEGNANTL